jgi:hypothetical protein
MEGPYVAAGAASLERKVVGPGRAFAGRCEVPLVRSCGAAVQDAPACEARSLGRLRRGSVHCIVCCIGFNHSAQMRHDASRLCDCSRKDVGPLVKSNDREPAALCQRLDQQRDLFGWSGVRAHCHCARHLLRQLPGQVRFPDSGRSPQAQEPTAPPCRLRNVQPHPRPWQCAP